MLKKPHLPSLKAIAPAKINLCLHITGKTQKGYHLLDSLVVFSDFGDEIIISQSQDGQSQYTLEIQNQQELRMDDHNLVVCAHKILEKFMDISLPCHIHLIKRLPMGAGIGGGSSDAAAVLRLLNAYFSLNLSQAKLQQIALPLGADVPVCLYGQSCYMSGIGEVITPIKGFPDLYMGLIYPDQSVSTKDIFQRFKPKFSAPLNRRECFDDFFSLHTWLDQHHNDLEPLAIELASSVGDILTNLRHHNFANSFFCGMSGSGSTCFVISPDQSTIEDCLALFSGSDYRLMQGKTLLRSG